MIEKGERAERREELARALATLNKQQVDALYEMADLELVELESLIDRVRIAQGTTDGLRDRIRFAGQRFKLEMRDLKRRIARIERQLGLPPIEEECLAESPSAEVQQ